MTKFQTWLSGLLLAQLLLAAVLFFSQQQGRQPKPEALLGFIPEQADKLIVSDAKQSVTLTKPGDNWIIPKLKQLPADAGKLNALLNRLKNLQAGWPVATTQSSHKRFEVAEDKFQRRLQFYQGDKPAGELYIGTSPGFKKSHVREPGDDNVYAVNVSSFEWPAKNDDWLDKSLLAAKDIDQIKGPDYVLQKKDDGWHFAAAEAATESDDQSKPQLDQVKAMELAMALAGLKVLAPVDQLPPGDNKTVTVDVSGPKDSWTYILVKAGDQYFVSRNDRDVLFSISQLDFDRIAGVDKAQLVLPAAAASGEESTKDTAKGSGNQGTR
ncbi:DUF4340 domain-containing protein [Methylomonas sp. MgM2]